MTGSEICRAVRVDPTLCLMWVLMLSARSFDADIEAGLAADADEYLAKPFRP